MLFRSIVHYNTLQYHYKYSPAQQTTTRLFTSLHDSTPTPHPSPHYPTKVTIGHDNSREPHDNLRQFDNHLLTAFIIRHPHWTTTPNPNKLPQPRESTAGGRDGRLRTVGRDPYVPAVSSLRVRDLQFSLPNIPRRLI